PRSRFVSSRGYAKSMYALEPNLDALVHFLEVCSAHLWLAGDPVHAALCLQCSTRYFCRRHGPVARRERLDTDETLQFGGVGRRSQPHARYSTREAFRPVGGIPVLAALYSLFCGPHKTRPEERTNRAHGVFVAAWTGCSARAYRHR